MVSASPGKPSAQRPPLFLSVLLICLHSLHLLHVDKEPTNTIITSNPNTTPTISTTSTTTNTTTTITNTVVGAAGTTTFFHEYMASNPSLIAMPTPQLILLLLLLLVVLLQLPSFINNKAAIPSSKTISELV